MDIQVVFGDFKLHNMSWTNNYTHLIHSLLLPIPESRYNWSYSFRWYTDLHSDTDYWYIHQYLHDIFTHFDYLCLLLFVLFCLWLLACLFAHWWPKCVTLFRVKISYILFRSLISCNLTMVLFPLMEKSGSLWWRVRVRKKRM